MKIISTGCHRKNVRLQEGNSAPNPILLLLLNRRVSAKLAPAFILTLQEGASGIDIE